MIISLQMGAKLVRMLKIRSKNSRINDITIHGHGK